jgi:hypothetical protein
MPSYEREKLHMVAATRVFLKKDCGRHSGHIHDRSASGEVALEAVQPTGRHAMIAAQAAGETTCLRARRGRSGMHEVPTGRPRDLVVGDNEGSTIALHFIDDPLGRIVVAAIGVGHMKVVIFGKWYLHTFLVLITI